MTEEERVRLFYRVCKFGVPKIKAHVLKKDRKVSKTKTMAVAMKKAKTGAKLTQQEFDVMQETAITCIGAYCKEYPQDKDGQEYLNAVKKGLIKLKSQEYMEGE